MAGQDSDGGRRYTENVYAASGDGVVGLSLVIWTVVETFLNTK
jgi:hypothetical protein